MKCLALIFLSTTSPPHSPTSRRHNGDWLLVNPERPLQAEGGAVAVRKSAGGPVSRSTLRAPRGYEGWYQVWWASR
ncbi:hypothetical protein EJ03DRAFT_323630 [Teratosphaeria nubilosa]|uniref:Uncharacterized protein n=1 Tax=Teratosphaeria nubilosa TaxID=161662 RepID=A0A6G1LL91_9PEZI|nr:hypothetical protein EJ03DRAFT_323630 [Teratosphaeria nubilosa]